MKSFNNSKSQVIFLHLTFWAVSIFFWNWNLLLYTSVDSSWESGWEYFIVLILYVFYQSYFFLPVIWLFKEVRLWKKITATLLFVLIPLFWYLILFEFTNLSDPKSDSSDYILASVLIFINTFYVIVFHITIIAAVIFNLKVLVPRFLNKIRFRVYLMSAIGLTILAATLNYSLFDYGIDILFPKLYYISYFKIWELYLIIAAYLLFTTIVILIWQYRQMLIARRESVQNELSALKAQINPHFLFNNLNTIYGMALQKNDRTPKVILQLSDFLRYVLYDTSSETIPLEKEVEIIRTYVNLQKERINPDITTVEFITKGDFKRVDIAPLLLLPLAENCFKYGKGKSKGLIKINIEYNGEQLQFSTANKITRREKPKAEKNSGIGLSNVEKRLNLIYPGQFTLEYGETEGIFRLKLTIKLIRTE